MKKLKLLSIALIALIMLFGATFAQGSEASLVKQYSDKEFDRYDRGRVTVFFHQRVVDEAIVEGDFLNYCFDTESEELIAKFSRWSENLPEALPKVISESEAFRIASGGEYAELYYLSPDSVIYRPAPETPVWVVWHAHEPGRWGNVTVIDAVTGEFMASGIPPISAIPRPTPSPQLPEPKVGGFNPWSYDLNGDCWISMSEAMTALNDCTHGYITEEELNMVMYLWQNNIRNPGCSQMAEAFVFTGPMFRGSCTGGWYGLVDNAEYYLSSMGYEVYRPTNYPNASVIEQYISNNETAVFYEACHGKSFYFENSCNDKTFTSEIEDWLEGYPKIALVFLGSCEAMCDGYDCMPAAFTKGCNCSTAVTGYCGMADRRCIPCTIYKLQWEELFFSTLSQGYTVGVAYNHCSSVYPVCEDCILFYGDENVRLVEKVERSDCICGCITGGVWDVNGNPLSGVTVELYKEGE